MKTLRYGEPEKERLDRYLSTHCEDLSRSRLQSLIKEGAIKVNGAAVKPNYLLTSGDEITMTLPPEQPATVTPTALPLDIVYEDRDLVIVNKSRGMVVHPAPGNQENTLVNALLAHCDDLSGIGGVLRPGIVHRIDKDTSGLLLVAKNDMAHLALAEQLKAHTIKRIYEAVVEGIITEKAGRIDCPIGRHPTARKKMAVTARHGRSAVTNYRVIERFAAHTYVECQLETGRTHQIRVHMQYIGHPLLGDTVYGKGKKNPYHFEGQALHAAVIGFYHPRTGDYLEFSADPPPVMTALLAALRQDSGP